MIAEIEQRLNEWARWAYIHPKLGLGFRHKTNEYRIYAERCHEAGTKSRMHGRLPDHETAEEMEAAINKIPDYFREILIQRYLNSLNDKDLAKAMHCSVPSVRKYLDEIHVYLAARLNVEWEIRLSNSGLR